MAKILAVDDSEITRDLIKLGLEKVGHQVLSIADSRDVERILNSQTFDLLITDIYMPEIDGFQIIEMARLKSPKLPIIVISGGSAHDQEKIMLDVAITSGADATLEKPFTLDDLIRLINQVI